MKAEKISGGNAIIGQIMILVFLIPLLGCLFFLAFIKNQSLEGLGFFTIFSGTAIFFFKITFDYSDIYLINNQILIKKLFTKRLINISEFKNIENAIMPLKYCIKFHDGTKTYFALSPSGMFKNIVSLAPDKALNELNLRFNKLKQQSIIVS